MILINATPYIPPGPQLPDAADFASLFVFPITMTLQNNGLYHEPGSNTLSIGGANSGQGSFSVSTDAGASWTTYGLPVPSGGSASNGATAVLTNGAQGYVSRSTGSSSDASRIQTSANYTSTWTNVSTSNNLGSGIRFAENSANQIALLTNSGRVNSTTSRTTWSSNTSVTAIAPNNLVAGNGIFLVVGSAGVSTSSNGTSWTNTTIASLNLLTARFDNGMWVGGGTNGKLMTSATGTSWTNQTTPLTDDVVGIAYGNGVWAALTSTKIAFSFDGITWVAQDPPTTSGNHSLAYVNGTFVYINDKTVYYLTY